MKLKTSEKAAFAAEKLEELFPHPPIPLRHRDAFTLLVAVVLSAQCTDERVNQVTKELFRLAPTPKAMLGLGRDRIQKIIRPCGLSPAKSSNIHKLSSILMEKFRARVPEDFGSLESLPGVGHKTASVVMSQAFGHAAFPVDTHIHRLAWRWGLSNGKNVEQTEKDLKRLFPANSWNALHLRMIYFGRAYCKARGHRRDDCPICSVIGRKDA